MPKRIVVGLDGSAFSESAASLAIACIKAGQGVLVGVAVVDVPGIESGSAGAALGASAYAKNLRELRLSDAQQKTRQFLATFESQCREAAVPYELCARSGNPCQELMTEAATADLLVIGQETHFVFETSDQPGDTLSDILHRGGAPLLTVPDRYAEPIENVLIAYTGAPSSAKALRVFGRLKPLPAPPKRAVLVHVGDREAQDRQPLRAARKYLAVHGIQAEERYESGGVTDALERLIVQLSPALLVMGANNSRSPWEFVFGSTIEKMIARRLCPILVAH